MAKKILLLSCLVFISSVFLNSTNGQGEASESNTSSNAIVKTPNAIILLKLFEYVGLPPSQTLRTIIKEIAGREMDIASLLMARDRYAYLCDYTEEKKYVSSRYAVVIFNSIIRGFFANRPEALEKNELFLREDLL